MIRPDLADAESAAFTAMCADPRDETHRAWLDARRAILGAIQATGEVVESLAAGTYTVYRIGRYGQLTRRRFPMGARP